MAILYMIGHFNHPLELFREMLEREKISVLYDIRMIPFSRYGHLTSQNLRRSQKWG